MMSDKKLFPGFQGWVHSPVPCKDRFSILTPRKVFNPSSCYRVTYSDLPIKLHEEACDVLAPTNRTTKNNHNSKEAFWAFYEGAEVELDRFLFWLQRAYLKNEYGSFPTLYVCLQKTECLQKELTELYGSSGVLFVAPGQLEHFSLLVHEQGKDLSVF